MIAGLGRYAGAGIGPILGAGGQFALSLLLLTRLSLGDFGRFSFLIVVSQFAIGLWSALFGAPMLVAAAQGQGVAAIDAAQRAALLPLAGAMLLLGLATGAGGVAAILFALFTALLLARQFARTRAMAHGVPARAIASDLIYGATLAIGCAVVLARPTLSLGGAVLPLLLAVVPALWPLRASVLGGVRGLGGYRAIWRRDSRWSLLGVLSTEGTVNSHSYIVTALYGATAFAPIAAAALLIRPITVAINALVEFERARFARDLAEGRIDRVRAGRRQLHAVLFAVWAGTAVVAVLLLTFAPELLFRGKFTLPVIALGAALWFAVALARQLHAPEGALLLAAGRFRELASISIGTAALSLGGVAAGLALGGPIWSIAGIVAGEGAYALILQRRASRFLARHRPLVGGTAA
ncbi:hypothetical protein [Sphingomonas sp. VNH70]|uniref:hypothetical protein n=1 Tax=Sphingomonas silueang TaxID=3156617 RepID=UPI0032B487FD